MSPNEQRAIGASARFANGAWTVAIIDMATAVAEKRSSQVGVVLGQLLPRGYERESFAGKTAHTLDKARIAELSKYVETSMKQLGVPGVSIGLVQDDKVVFAGGFGVRELGKPAKVDADFITRTDSGITESRAPSSAASSSTAASRSSPINVPG